MLSRPHVPLCAPLAALSLVLPRLASADSVVTDNSTSWYATTAPVQTFHSSNVTPPEWNVLTLDAERVSEGSVLLSYRGTATSQAAPLIMDNNGQSSSAAARREGLERELMTRERHEQVRSFGPALRPGSATRWTSSCSSTRAKMCSRSTRVRYAPVCRSRGKAEAVSLTFDLVRSCRVRLRDQRHLLPYLVLLTMSASVQRLLLGRLRIRIRKSHVFRRTRAAQADSLLSFRLRSGTSSRTTTLSFVRFLR